MPEQWESDDIDSEPVVLEATRSTSRANKRSLESGVDSPGSQPPHQRAKISTPSFTSPVAPSSHPLPVEAGWSQKETDATLNASMLRTNVESFDPTKSSSFSSAAAAAAAAESTAEALSNLTSKALGSALGKASSGESGASEQSNHSDKNSVSSTGTALPEIRVAISALEMKHWKTMNTNALAQGIGKKVLFEYALRFVYAYLFSNHAFTLSGQTLDLGQKTMRTLGAKCKFPFVAYPILSTGQRYYFFTLTWSEEFEKPVLQYHGVRGIHVLPYSGETDPDNSRLQIEKKVSKEEVEEAMAALYACLSESLSGEVEV